LLELVRLSQPARVKSCLLRHRALRHRFVVIISRLVCTSALKQANIAGFLPMGENEAKRYFAPTVSKCSA
jgi:hypothetical protein